jgi:UDP-N-acetylglucosamine 4-epimerase
MATNKVNVGGFVNMLFASHKNSVKRFIYASSSSVYGNDKTMPKKEETTGDLLSPYAVSKKANELYADVFNRTYGLEIIGLRYFNVFGPKQNINGPYAAVIPIFITSLLNNRPPTIFGNGETTRDFTFVENVIQANLLACLTQNNSALNQVYNIAYGGTTSLNELFRLIASELNTQMKPDYANERKGDIKDSFANIDKAKANLLFSPKVDLKEGISKTVSWYKENIKREG